MSGTYLVIRDGPSRRRCVAHLPEQGISTVVNYPQALPDSTRPYGLSGPRSRKIFPVPCATPSEITLSSDAPVPDRMRQIPPWPTPSLCFLREAGRKAGTSADETLPKALNGQTGTADLCPKAVDHLPASPSTTMPKHWAGANSVMVS